VSCRFADFNTSNRFAQLRVTGIRIASLSPSPATAQSGQPLDEMLATVPSQTKMKKMNKEKNRRKTSRSW